MAKTSKKIDWDFWGRFHRVPVWQACLLSVGINPDGARDEMFPPDFLMFTSEEQMPELKGGCFPSVAVQGEYHQRLRVVRSHLRNPVAFSDVDFNPEHLNLCEVQPGQFAALFLRLGLEIPAALSSMATRVVAPARDHIS